MENEYFQKLFQDLVRFLIRLGWSRWDAEDAVQTALTELVARRAGVRTPKAYARTVALRAVLRPRREVPSELEWLAEPAADDVHDSLEVEQILRECLTVLWRRPIQQTTMSLTFQGYTTAEITEALDTLANTVASNRRHAREKLVSVCADDRHEKRRIQVLHDVYDAHLRGVRLPIAPRRIITWAWDRAQALKLNPERGAPVPLIDENELADRRERSPLAGDGAWVLRRMAELATDTGTMSVVTDSDGVVLWRDGDRTVMAKADNARFTLRAKWDFSTAGPGGIALALLRRTMVTVCRFEHYVQTQHDLSCVATSVRDPRDGRQWILNLTGTRSSIHPAVLRELDTIALRWKRQLAAGPDPACRAFT